MMEHTLLSGNNILYEQKTTHKYQNIHQPMYRGEEITQHVQGPRIQFQVTPFNHLFYIKTPERFCDTPGGQSFQSSSIKTEDYPLNEKNDKVVVILQNILRNLENDMEHDRLRLKEEKRKRQKERRQRREEKRESAMSSQRVGTSRHVFSTVNYKPLTVREGNAEGEHHKSSWVSRKDTAKIKKHDSFSASDLKQKNEKKEIFRDFLELGSHSLDRKRTESFGVSDWSRHSRDVEDIDDTDAVISATKFSLPKEEGHDLNTDPQITETKTDVNWSKRQMEYHKISPRNFLIKTQSQDKFTNFQESSSDSQGTPTNIRRKLKAFDLLPNYKRNGIDVNKSKEYAHICLDSNSVKAVQKPGRVIKTADNFSKVDKPGNVSSSEDDDMDIVFPTLRNTHSLKLENVNRNVNFYTGKEPNNKSDTNTGHTEDKSNKSIDLQEPTKRGSALKFRLKSKTPGFGNIATRRNEAERPTSAGTSGYSTDEYSYKATDSEDESVQEREEKGPTNNSRNKYFLVLQNGINMALKVDHSVFQHSDYADESSRSFLQNISMSDLAIPDQVGWLVNQSEQNKVWGVIVDMLFCVFECEGSVKPREVIILPGCSIRPLVYNTAINGVNSNTPSQTITGISKYQFVIDDSSTGRKHVFGTESQNDLDTWFRVLKRASTLDPEITNDISTSNGVEDAKSPYRRFSFDGVLPKMGYTPSLDSTRRSQRMRSPREPNEKPKTNGFLDDNAIPLSTNEADSLPNGNQPSPRSGLVRNDSRRQSISDFKKRLRQETKPEISKQLPVKATHFKQNTQENNTQAQNGKKLKSFGSFESLLKFKRKKRKQSEDSASNDDTGSIISESSTDQETSSRSVDISSNISKLQKGKKLSRSLEYSAPKNNINTGIVRRASDIKDRVFNRRPSKPFAKLGDLHDTSMHGFLLHKHHLKWQKLWCVVCRGCFYGFKSNSPIETAHVSVLLSSCGVVFVSKQDKKQKHLYVFKITQEKSKSIYLCSTDYNDLMKWLTVLQMESNSVISNADKIGKSSESENDSICSSLSSQSGSVLTVSSGEQPPDVEISRSRTKKKKKPPAKPPRKFRNSSCPPSVSRECGTSTGEDTLTSGSISSSNETNSYGSTEELPRYDRAVTHVWQNDRGYLFNAIRAKLTAYRKKDGNIFNKDLPGASNEGLLVEQDGIGVTVSKHIFWK